MNDEISFDELIHYGIFVTVSIVLSFLISSFEILDDLGFNNQRGLYLFISLLIIFILIFIILDKKVKQFKLFINEKYNITNLLIFLTMIMFSLFIIKSLYEVYNFNYSLPFGIYWEAKNILRTDMYTYNIMGSLILIFTFFVYSLLFNLKLKKLKLLKAIIFSLFHTILAIVAFFIVSIIIRIIYYAILLGTVGLTVG